MPKFIVAGICAITRRFAFGSSVAESRQNSLINTEACINLRESVSNRRQIPALLLSKRFRLRIQAGSVAGSKQNSLINKKDP
jgi:hypothetical protein